MYDDRSTVLFELLTNYMSGASYLNRFFFLQIFCRDACRASPLGLLNAADAPLDPATDCISVERHPGVIDPDGPPASSVGVRRIKPCVLQKLYWNNIARIRLFSAAQTNANLRALQCQILASSIARA